MYVTDVGTQLQFASYRPSVEYTDLFFEIHSKQITPDVFDSFNFFFLK